MITPHAPISLLVIFTTAIFSGVYSAIVCQNGLTRWYSLINLQSLVVKLECVTNIQ